MAPPFRRSEEVGTASPTGAAPPFDPECALALETIPAERAASMTPASIPELRAADRRAGSIGDEELRRSGRFRVIQQRMPREDGASIPLLVCQPTASTAPTGVVVYLHGGGLVLGDERTRLDHVLDWADEFSLAVVSVGYRLAPEHRHPVPVEDCYAALEWTRAHADELNVDPELLILAGVSAGGGLAAAVALMSRDRSGPRIAAQLLMSPMLDDRNDSVSARQMAGRGIWDRASNRTGWASLLGDSAGGADVSPYAAPARARDLSNLPPTFLDVGSAETFRHEVVEYALAMWRDGGDCELHVWPGGFHGYVFLAPDARLTVDSVRARFDWLRRLLSRAA
jgi:acetyl esterase/lipase